MSPIPPDPWQMAVSEFLTNIAMDGALLFKMDVPPPRPRTIRPPATPVCAPVFQGGSDLPPRPPDCHPPLGTHTGCPPGCRGGGRRGTAPPRPSQSARASRRTLGPSTAPTLAKPPPPGILLVPRGGGIRAGTHAGDVFSPAASVWGL